MVSFRTTRPKYIADKDDQTVVVRVGASSGANGLSAYELAVDNGFVGTEEEWLDSLGSGSEAMATFAETESLAVLTTSASGDITLERFGS